MTTQQPMGWEYRFERIQGTVQVQKKLIETLGREGWKFEGFINHFAPADGKPMIFSRLALETDKSRARAFSRSCEEWLKGCSHTQPGSPRGCWDCTNAFLTALEDVPA